MVLDAASPMGRRTPSSGGGGKENRRRPKVSCDDEFIEEDEAPLVVAAPPKPQPPLAERPAPRPEPCVHKLLAASPRAGGLLEALRARGTLQALLNTCGGTLPASLVAASSGQIGGNIFRIVPSPSVSSSPVVGRAAPAVGVVPETKEKRKVLTKKRIAKPAQASPPREPDLSTLLRRVPLGPKIPEENYEISDKEEDSDMEDEDREEKAIPAWCEAYHEQLAQQENVDPDSIFGTKVPVCNLDLIFTDELYRARGCPAPRRKRGSSCLWHKDRLRLSEVSAYRAKMGHRRRWSVLNKSLKKKIPQQDAANGPLAAS